MANARMVSRAPDSDSSLVTKKYASDYNAGIVVDATYVNARIAAEIASNSLQTKTYVDDNDALRAQTSQVTAADANYLNATQLGQANGVPLLDADGDIIAGQLPTLVTDRVATAVAASGGGIILGSSSQHTCTTSSIREFKLATLAVTDPGFPWIPMPFATVTGWSADTDPGSRIVSTNSVGQLAVMKPTGTEVYGAGVCAGVYNRPNLYVVMPYGASNMTPITQPAITGGATLDLYGSCLQGTNYVFHGVNLTFHVLVVPSM